MSNPSRRRVSALRWKSVAIGTTVAVAMLMQGTATLRAAFGDTRTLTFYNIHTKETTAVLYKKDGKPVPGALDKLNWALRDWRKDEKTQMDPALFDLLWDIYAEVGSKEPIHVISAYRSRGTNDMLRKTVGGQAGESRHILGKAIDVHFPDVDLKKLRYSALIREQGGVGYYPTSALPFVHIDTDRVRHWPRLPRYELALLFPNGQTKHQPADGGPITTEDARVAKAKHQQLASEVASFHDFRRTSKSAFALADSSALVPLPTARPAPPRTGVTLAAAPPAPLPQLTEAPRLVDRPSRLTGPSATDRIKMTELMKLAMAEPAPRLVQGPQPARRAESATLPSLSGAEISAPPAKPAAPRVAAVDPRAGATDVISDLLRSGFSNGFVAAPAFDEEHPEELSYRPFPIAPLMTLTSSTDDPALSALTHPDAAKTLELLDQAGSMPPMNLRPVRHVAALMWAQQFKGEAVSVGTFRDEPSDVPAPNLANRKVTTTR